MQNKTAVNSKSFNQTTNNTAKLTVFIIIGFVVLLQHIPHSTIDSSTSTLPGKLVWIQESSLKGNLYFLPPAPFSWNNFYHEKGYTLPDVPLAYFSYDISSNSYFIDNNKAPHAINLPDELSPIFFKPISINTAPIEILDTIPGIGLKLAEKIISYRENNGRIQDGNDLLKVNGIGQKKLVEIEKQIKYH